MTNPAFDFNADDGVLAASFAARWLASYHAQDDQARVILQTLDHRGLAMMTGALGEIFIQTLAKLERDGALQGGGVQQWLDRLALNTGAAADAVAAKYRNDGEN